MKKSLNLITKLFINNEFVTSSVSRTIPVINPATEETICHIEEAGEQDVENAIQAAHQAFQTWKHVTAKDRAAMIRNLAGLIRKNQDELAQIECLGRIQLSIDNGKPQFLAKLDILMVAESLEYFAGQADKIHGKTFSTNDKFCLTSYRREAFGVVGLISPWNYPLLMAEWKFGPALAAGNTIVMKVSEETPLSTLKICEYFLEAGFPPGVFNVIPGYGNVAGEYLINHKMVKKIGFTGSTMVGRKIMAASSQSNLKKVHLELGGKSPFIVCPDVDLDYVAQQAWDAIMTNSGQVCDAGSKLYIHETIYDQLIEKIVAINKSIVIGNAFEDERVNLGPLINKRQFQSVMGFINHGIEIEKLKCVLGGKRHGDKGYFVEPTIFTQVPEDSKLSVGEIFGPVLCVMKPWKTLEEVIQLANSSQYGLAGYVFSNNIDVCEKLISSLEVGSVYCNMLGLASAHVPFGGYKESGFGRDNGVESVDEFTQIKAIYQGIKEPKL